MHNTRSVCSVSLLFDLSVTDLRASSYSRSRTYRDTTHPPNRPHRPAAHTSFTKLEQNLNWRWIDGKGWRYIWHLAFLGRLLGLLQSNLLLEGKTTVHYIIGISLALGDREGHGMDSLHTRCLITNASRRALGLDVADDELEGAWMKFSL